MSVIVRGRQPVPEDRKTKFKVGDRVSRPEDVYAKKWKLKHGEVVAVYAKRSRVLGNEHFDPEVYDVLFDGEDAPRKGFFAHGLDTERGWLERQ